MKTALMLFGNDIYIMNPDGSNQVKLTNMLGSAIGPKYSPVGSKILLLVTWHSIIDRPYEACSFYNTILMEPI